MHPGPVGALAQPQASDSIVGPSGLGAATRDTKHPDASAGPVPPTSRQAQGVRQSWLRVCGAGNPHPWGPPGTGAAVRPSEAPPHPPPTLRPHRGWRGCPVSWVPRLPPTTTGPSQYVPLTPQASFHQVEPLTHHTPHAASAPDPEWPQEGQGCGATGPVLTLPARGWALGDPSSSSSSRDSAGWGQGLGAQAQHPMAPPELE